MLFFRGGRYTIAVSCMFKFLIINFLVLKVAVVVSAIRRTRLCTILQISPRSENSFLKLSSLSTTTKKKNNHYACNTPIGIPFLNTVGFIHNKGHQIVSIHLVRQHVTPFQENQSWVDKQTNLQASEQGVRPAH